MQQTLSQRTWAGLKGWLRRDGWVVAAYLIAVSIATYPMILHLADKNWLAIVGVSDRRDLYPKLWDVWYLTTQLGNGNSYFHTSLLYYPTGADLTFHNFNLLHILLVDLFNIITRNIAASFNYAALLTLLLNAYTAYLLILTLTGNQESGFYGGLIFGIMPWNLIHMSVHPEVMTLFVLPLLILSFIKAITLLDWKYAALAGILGGLSAYVGLYILAAAGITLLLILAAMTIRDKRWARREFWMVLALMAIIAGAIMMPRITPLLADSSQLGAALSEKYKADAYYDILSYVIPLKLASQYTSLLRQHVSWTSWLYVGIIPLGFAFVGLIAPTVRRKSAGWLLIAIFFMVLTLGTYLSVGSRVLTSFEMPRAFLDRVLPLPFRMFRNPRFYFIGVLLPTAIATAEGMKYVLGLLPKQQYLRIAFVGILAVVTLVDYWIGPFRQANLNYSMFFEQIQKSDEEFAILYLPMDRNSTKYYNYLQTIHHQPRVDGFVAREVSANFQSIKGNLLLSMWYSSEKLDCTQADGDQMESAVKDLVTENVRYIIISVKGLAPLSAYFEGIDPTYQDKLIVVYKVDDLMQHPPCSR
jgi:hypothetical protein